ncbi:MAG: LysR family transcriptional regulator [Pseudomonadota bacterium]
MNWDDLRLIDAAARARSLSAAAKAVGVSQPQISRRLRQLEESVGARLFDRTPQGLRPTAAGERLIPLAARMREAADAVARVGASLAEDGLATVRISVDEVRERFLTRRLPALRAALPDVALEIMSAQIHANHETRETEIQLRSCLPESETLIVRRLGGIAYAVYGGRDYAIAHPAARSEARYAACDWIGLAPDRLWYPEQERWLADRLSRRPALRVNTMTAMVDAAAAGAGLALIPAFMGDERPELVRLSETIHTTAEHVIAHRDLLREPAVRRTVDALVALYRAARPALLGEPAALAAE